MIYQKEEHLAILFFYFLLKYNVKIKLVKEASLDYQPKIIEWQQPTKIDGQISGQHKKYQMERQKWCRDYWRQKLKELLGGSALLEIIPKQNS